MAGGRGDRETPRPGDALYVPAGEVSAAMSLGAVVHEGDARLHVPSILPDNTSGEDFARWTGATAKIVWIGEFLEGVVGAPIDLMDVAGLLETAGSGFDSEDGEGVPLYVPRQEMDRARLIPGVAWDRRRRLYVADRTADFRLVHPYLTPAMRAAWIAERNLDVAMGSMVRARAMIAGAEGGGDRLAPRALERGSADERTPPAG